MKLLIPLIYNQLKKPIRFFYWLYKIICIKSGKNCSIAYPLRVEGKGKIIFADNVKIQSNVYLGCGENAHLYVGDGTTLNSGVEIYLSKGKELCVGKGVTINSTTKMYVGNNWKIGRKTYIARNCDMMAREPGCAGKLSVGNECGIGDYSIIDVSDDITIGNRVALGSRCTIYTHDHDYNQTGISAPWKGKPITKPVIINSGAWIGANVTILPGVVIGECAIVATGSVVTKNVAPNTIVAGVPAKEIKKINNSFIC